MLVNKITSIQPHNIRMLSYTSDCASNGSPLDKNKWQKVEMVCGMWPTIVLRLFIPITYKS